MLMKITLPKMGELLVMMMTMISPSGREVPSAESLRWRAKVFGKVDMLDTYHSPRVSRILGYL